MSNRTREFIDGVFSEVAPKYDLMNDLMSFGIHRIWRRKLVNCITNKSGSLIDVASGTGAISLSYLHYALKKNYYPQLTLVDPCKQMLSKAKFNFLKAEYLENVNFVESYAENLPFEENSFDNYSIAYGMRNTTCVEKSLQEAYRVIKPSGSFYCLEFAPVKTPILKKFYKLYSRICIPMIGKMVLQDSEPYRYLVDSIENFDSPEKFKSRMLQAGFQKIKHTTLSSGIAIIYRGEK